MSKLNSIQEALEDIKQGKVVIVVDDENRENEGDFICASEFASDQVINFMATHGRGLICVSILEDRAQELGLDLMVKTNTASYETPFTVSVDLIGNGCTTGISAQDRSKTIAAIIDKDTKPAMLGKPGHIFPLKAKKGGVLRRAGHTEASLDLARLAGLYPSGVLVEILNEDGSMARVPDLYKIAEKFNLKMISIEDLIAYRLSHDSLITRDIEIELPTSWGDFKMISFTENLKNIQHLAVVKGEWQKDDPILVRVHSSCVTGDIFGSCRCDCGPQLEAALQMIEKEGRGMVLYMQQEGRGIGLLNKLKAYKLQEQGFDTVEANLKLGFKSDQRDYGVGAQILRSLNATKLRLMSNNPAKRTGLSSYGIEIVESVPIQVPHNEHNKKYLQTKKEKMGHRLTL